MKMKRLVAGIMAVAMCGAMLVGCSSSTKNATVTGYTKQATYGNTTNKACYKIWTGNYLPYEVDKHYTADTTSLNSNNLVFEMQLIYKDGSTEQAHKDQKLSNLAKITKKWNTSSDYVESAELDAAKKYVSYEEITKTDTNTYTYVCGLVTDKNVIGATYCKVEFTSNDGTSVYTISSAKTYSDKGQTIGGTDISTTAESQYLANRGINLWSKAKAFASFCDSNHGTKNWFDTDKDTADKTIEALSEEDGVIFVEDDDVLYTLEIADEELEEALAEIIDSSDFDE